MRAHVTHYDDCGCKTETYEKELAEVRSWLETRDAELDAIRELLAQHGYGPHDNICDTIHELLEK